MKKIIISILGIAIVALFGMTFSSCNNDEEEKTENKSNNQTLNIKKVAHNDPYELGKFIWNDKSKEPKCDYKQSGNCLHEVVIVATKLPLFSEFRFAILNNQSIDYIKSNYTSLSEYFDENILNDVINKKSVISCNWGDKAFFIITDVKTNNI